MLVGNNIALVVYSIYMSSLLNPYIIPRVSSPLLVLLSETLISTIFVLFLGEFLPKAVFSLNPNRSLNFFKIPLIGLYYLLFLPSYIIIGISEGILKLFMKVNIHHESFSFGIIDLNHYLQKMTKKHVIKDVDNEFTFLRNALEFSSTKARECMIPRNEVEAVELEAGLDELLQKFIRTGLSRIMVYRENVDSIVGYIHSSAMFDSIDQAKNNIQPVIIVPESMKANDVMKSFISGKKNVAVVVDEFGGTSGIITREDLLEEIFGEIDDEHDFEELIRKKISDREYIFSARMEIDYINENFGLNIPESDDYETLAGFILSHTESIPKEGDNIVIGRFGILVTKVSASRVELVRLKIREED